MHTSFSYSTINYLSTKYKFKTTRSNICINSRIIPDPDLVSTIKELGQNEGLFIGDVFIACNVNKDIFEKYIRLSDFSPLKPTTYSGEIKQITHITDLYSNNQIEINSDIDLVDNVNNKISDPHTVCYNPDQIFVGEGANIKSCVLDAESGPIFIGDRVTMGPGAVVIGPAAILEGSVISIGSKIRGNTTVGPFCKIGGEINQVIFQGYSNKSHDGFLGSSVIGEWCNFGAGSNNSNLKNNYSAVKLWDYEAGKYLETGLQYCGLIMGDYSKCGINTMFNTGTVVGVCANIFGYGYMPKFIPSFSWGNNEGFVDYQIDKAVETIRTVMLRRNQTFGKKEKEILQHLFDFTAKYRGRI